MGLPLAAHRVAVEAAERLVLPAAWARADLAAAEGLRLFRLQMAGVAAVRPAPPILLSSLLSSSLL